MGLAPPSRASVAAGKIHGRNYPQCSRTEPRFRSQKPKCIKLEASPYSDNDAAGSGLTVSVR